MHPELIALRLIFDNPWQPRQSYNDDAIAQLAASIAANGLLQTPVARVLDEDGDIVNLAQIQHEYANVGDLIDDQGWRVQLAFGHSRLRAFRLLHEQDKTTYTMPLILRHLTDEQMYMACEYQLDGEPR